jgi:hypothetical protein
MTIRGVALAFEHHHTSLLLDLDVVTGEVPGSLEDFRLDKFGHSLQDQVSLLETKLVR